MYCGWCRAPRSAKSPQRIAPASGIDPEQACGTGRNQRRCGHGLKRKIYELVKAAGRV